MASIYDIQKWYWLVTDSSPGTQVFSSKDEDFVPLANADYVAWLAADGGNAPNTIPTAAELWALFDYNSRLIWKPGTRATFSTGSSNIFYPLLNPTSELTEVTFNGASADVALPIMRSPRAVPIGVPFKIKNVNTGNDDFRQISYQDASTFLRLVNSGDTVTFMLTDNSTKNGTIQVVKETDGSSLGEVRQLAGSSSTSTLSLDCYGGVVFRDKAGIPIRLPTAWLSSCNINITTSGPAAGGRDQSSAFSSGDIVHFYFIYKSDGSSLQGTVSLNGPDDTNAGPVLPTGYTAWAYITTLKLTGTNLPIVYVRGNKVFYQAQQSVLSAGSANAATPTTSVDMSAVVPKPASGAFAPSDIMIRLVAADTGAAGNTSRIGLVSGTTYTEIVAPVGGTEYAFATIPFLGATVYYNNSVAAGRTSIDVLGYTVPNTA